VEPMVMEELLRYIYTDKVENVESVAKPLLVAADKYGLDNLKKTCEAAMLAQLGVDDAVTNLIVADLHRCPHLKEAALATIRRFPEKVVTAHGWNDLVKSHPRLVSDIVLSQQRPSVTDISNYNSKESIYNHRAIKDVGTLNRRTEAGDNAQVPQLHFL